MSRPCVRRRNAAPALVGALACVLALLVAAPADASPGAAKWPWVSAQAVQGSKVAVHVAWNKVARSKKYRISYAPLKGRLNAGEVSTSRSRKTRTVRRVAGKVQGAWISGLKPGRFYCFQVQGLSGRKTGRASGMHCKMTTRTSRVRPVAGTDLAIATYNTCSTACASTLHTDWDTVRRPLVEQRIREMRAASTGRPVDVVAVEEGNDATSDLTTDLAGTFTRACQTGDGTGNVHEDNQSVFLRDGAWEVAAGSQPGGMNFRDIGSDGSHGACWVRIRSLATGREVVVVALHLYAPSTEAGDRIRKAQTEAVVAAVNAAHPGATSADCRRSSDGVWTVTAHWRVTGGRYANLGEPGNRPVNDNVYNGGARYIDSRVRLEGYPADSPNGEIDTYFQQMIAPIESSDDVSTWVRIYREYRINLVCS